MGDQLSGKQHTGLLGGERRGYVDVDGMLVHYARGGEGEGAVVLLHEVPRSWTQFGPSIPHLAPAAQWIAIDLPGYGMSDPFSERATAVQYAQVVGAAIARLATGQVWICGVHSGALFAAIVAAHRYADVAGLLLTGLPMFGAAGPPPQTPPSDVLGPTYDGSHVGRVVPHFQAKWSFFGPTHRLHDAALQALQAVDRLYVGYDAVFGFDTAQIIPLLECPVHFLSAQEDGMFAHDLVAAGMLPQSTMHIAHGIGRDLPWNAPLWYSRRIRSAIGATGAERLRPDQNRIPHRLPEEPRQ